MGIPGLGGSLLPNQFMYKRQGPWPQPSPSHPMTCADEVLNVPTDETVYFELFIGRRYLQAMSDYPPCAARYVRATDPHWRPSTGDFDTIMYSTLYTRFLTPLSDDDKQRLADAKVPYGPATMKYDFTAMNMLEPLPGTYCAATVVIVDTSKSPWSTVCIFLSPISSKGPHDPAPAEWICIKPTDTAWTLGMAFALQGAAYHVLFVVHPAIHFPTDSVNAITKSAIPIAHPLFQLLYPHSTYQLPLDNAVLESAASVVNDNAYGTRYDPLTAEAHNLKRLFGAGFSGLTAVGYDRNAYPRYDYMKPVMSFRSTYATYLTAYYKAFLSFCEPVAAVLVTHPYGKYVTRWAHYVAAHVPGFPGETEILDTDTLANALAIYMWNNSVAHGADHYSFTYDISVVQKCLRLRIPPPATPGTQDPGTPLFTPDDLARAALCQWMYFHPWAIAPNLIDTQYPFAEEVLYTASLKFQTALKTVDREYGKGFMPLEPPANAPDPAPPAVPPAWNPFGLPKALFPPVSPYAVTLPQSIQY